MCTWHLLVVQVAVHDRTLAVLPCYMSTTTCCFLYRVLRQKGPLKKKRAVMSQETGAGAALLDSQCLIHAQPGHARQPTNRVPVVAWPACRHQLVREIMQTIKARCRLEDWAAGDIAKELAALRQQASQPPDSTQGSSACQAGRQASAAAACQQPCQAASMLGKLPQQCGMFPKAAAAAAAFSRQTRGGSAKKDVAADIPLFVELLSHGRVQVQVEAAGLLGDLANGSKQHKTAISQAGGVQALLRLSEEGSSSTARASALAALGCMCRGRPGHQAEVEMFTLSLLGNLRSHHSVLQEESAILLQRMCADSVERKAALRANADAVDALVDLLESRSDSRAASPAAAAAVRCLHMLARDKQFRARLCQPPGNVINSLVSLLGEDTPPEIQADSVKLLRRLSFDSQSTRAAIDAAAHPALERLRKGLDAADKLLAKLGSSLPAPAAAAQN